MKDNDLNLKDLEVSDTLGGVGEGRDLVITNYTKFCLL
jgi:hypothetical protein